MPLQSRLDAITARTQSLVQPERLAAVSTFVDELVVSGAETRSLSVGSLVPEFKLIDGVTSRLVRSGDLLALGPVVLLFFRGRWCPYDMAELEAWQELQPELRRRGALLVAVSPQLPRQNDFTAAQHKLTFPLLSDPGCELAAKFGVAYELPEPMQQHYRSILVNLPFLHGDERWQLPMPATFVLTPQDSGEARITFARTHADHRVRSEPSADLLPGSR